MDNDNLI